MKHLPRVSPNLVVFVIGLAMLAAGAFLVYPPAGLIVPGGILVAISVFGERKT